MRFVAICFDKADTQELRLTHCAAHLDYLRANAKTIKSCRPFLADDGVNMVGSMLIVEAKNRAEVDTILEQDPTVRPGSSTRSTCAAGAGRPTRQLIVRWRTGF